MRKRNIVLMTLFVCAFALTARAQGVNNAELQGNYAFSFTGMTSGDGVSSTPFGAVGRFTADGAGNLTNGELDSNGLGVSLGGVEKAVALAFTGTYSIGADNRGVMNLNIPGGGTLAFAMLSNGNAKFVEVDASGNHGTVGSGTMEKVDSAAYNTAKITGDYAFGAAGLDQSNNRSAIAGRFSANGMGLLSNGAADENMSGRFITLNLVSGTYMVTDTTTGRGTMSLPAVIGGSLPNLDFVFYVVNSRKLFIMDMDAVTSASPLLNGTVLQQQGQTSLGFSDASLNGSSVMYASGANIVSGWLLTAGGVGTFTLDAFGPSSPGTYSVASNGRVDFRIQGDYFAAYVVSPNEFFFIIPDSNASFGFAEPQAAQQLTNSSLSGAYSGVTTVPGNINVPIFSGEFTADGASNVTGIQDIGAPSGPTLGAAVNATYSISSTTNGKGTMNGGIEGTIYVISPSKFVVLTTMSAAKPGVYVPCVLIFEK